MKRRYKTGLAAALALSLLAWAGGGLAPSRTAIAESSTVGGAAEGGGKAEHDPSVDSGSVQADSLRADGPEAASGAAVELPSQAAAAKTAGAAGLVTEEATAITPAESAGAGAEAEPGAQLELAAENEALALYVNRSTAEIAVRQKSSGALWYSNPPGRADDPLATEHNRKKLGAQFELTYADNAGKLGTYDSFTHSVQSGQFEVQPSASGVKLLYTLGQAKQGIDEIPHYISKERFESLILDKIASQTERRDVEKRFKYVEEEQRYERRDSTFNSLGLSKVLRILEEIGYDAEQRGIDKAAYGDDSGGTAGFKLSLVYALEGEELIVTLPGAELSYPEQLHLQSIDLLPYFGAGSTADEGYLLVPDGSGALIAFNHGRLGASPYSSAVYGQDKAIIQKVQLQSEEPVRLPIFGIKNGSQAMLGIIESGDAQGIIKADVSGRIHSYNTVYSSYTISSREEVTLSAGSRASTVQQFQKSPYGGDITVRYGFMTEAQANYSGMAAYYRNYLVERTGMRKLEAQRPLPFYAELLGGIPKQRSLLGIPYASYEALTTFEQAGRILSELQAAGVDGLQVRYTGWFNGGVNHELPTSIRVDSRLGGADGLKQLQQSAAQRGIGLFPDVALLQVYQDTWRYSPSKDGARFITGRIAQIYPYDLASRRQLTETDPTYLLRPGKLADVASSFRNEYSKLSLGGLSLRDLGAELHADYNPNRVVSREQAKELVAQELPTMRAAAGELLLDGGNAYAMPYARHAVNVPLDSSHYLITDESVPFFQLVFHGYVDYAGEPLNLAQDQDRQLQLLKLLETGASPYYTWFYADASSIIQTDFDHLYASDYRNWLQEASELYRELSAALGDTGASAMTSHRKLEPGVYRTDYENGKQIIVNYNGYAIQVQGQTLAAKSYRVGSGAL